MLLLNYQIVSSLQGCNYNVKVELTTFFPLSVTKMSSDFHHHFSTGMPLKHCKGFFEYWQAFKHFCTSLAMASMFSLCSLLPVDELLCISDYQKVHVETMQNFLSNVLFQQNSS